MTKGSELTPDELEGMLVRKPKVLARDEVVLESETEEVQNQVLEVRDGVKEIGRAHV